ncbi:peptide chain release factor N(5)-glutamine methyltransferase [Butyrivibrio sp. NC3005]|uniref:peptide chain release factor N(5)-glutamine methyltransferase n=1 Tax=Butyrivibrio sp. NC3005 TaxID=1280685 RepID=UPI0003F561B0|nr:peptide chain release factor N(5)-glutamine methyltransferase [Butyrivibrio sp. NC3005]
MEYKKAYENACSILKEAGVVEYELDARLLLEEVCHTNMNTLLIHGDRLLSTEEIDRYDDFVKQRAARKPLAYIVGHQEFMGLDFKVTSDVLVPNQDTETLVEEALRELSVGMNFLDLCTGSGCIALSLLNYMPDTTAVATDLSKKALEVAKTNSTLLNLEDRIKFENVDLFPSETDKRFDMIVSNPPYIPTKVIETLPEEVKNGEPYMALDGAEDGLIFYKRIVEKAPQLLFSSGYLMFEIGYDQGMAVKKLMEDAGFHEVCVVKDLGGNDRVVKGVYY